MVKPRRSLVLAAAAVGAAGLALWILGGPSTPAPAEPVTGPARPGSAKAEVEGALPRIGLARVDQASGATSPAGERRDVFAFGPDPQVEIERQRLANATPPPPVDPTPTPVPTPTPLPPLNVKYIGSLESKPGIKVAGTHSVDLVVLGISTGGPQALKRLIPQLPGDFPVPVVMVMHMPVGYTEMYAAKLNELSNLEVREAAEGDELKTGRVFLAPAGRHLTLKRNVDGKVVTHLDARPFSTLHRPSVDVLFQSAAEVYRNRVLGVVMTGMGSDGKQGAAWIKSQGGLVFTEAESSCVVYGMPGVVVEAGLSDKSIALENMAHAIREVV